MNKLNKTTIIGLLVFCVLLGISLTTWISSGEKTSETTESNLAQEVSTTSPSRDQESVESSTEMGTVYEEEGSEPIIQISEETLSKGRSRAAELEDPNGLQIPTGFGIAQDAQNQAQNLDRMPVELETPMDKAGDGSLGTPQEQEIASPNSQEGLNNPPADHSSIEASDPREVGITANDGPEQNYEETALSVQRTLTAVNSQGERQLIRMKIPVMYKSRTLRLEGETKKQAIEILNRLKEKSQQLSNMKKEIDTDLVDWNNLVKATTPYDTLLPESPSLPQNQSAGGLNRDGNPEMSAGKSISYEIVPAVVED